MITKLLISASYILMLQLFLPVILSMVYFLMSKMESYEVKEFSNEDLKWFESYESTNTIIFQSENLELDTIIFFEKKSKTESTRNFSQGYSDRNYLLVSYEFLENSYHKFSKDSNKRKNLLNLQKSTGGSTSLEIVFIGTLFNKRSLKNIAKIDDNTYVFKSSKATYSGLNVNKGIKSFTFNTKKGIVKYTDNRNIKWERQYN